VSPRQSPKARPRGSNLATLQVGAQKKSLNLLKDLSGITSPKLDAQSIRSTRQKSNQGIKVNNA